SSFRVLADEEPDEDLAILAAQAGRVFFFTGDLDRAEERLEFALRIAESLWLPGVLSEALNTKSLILHARGRTEESYALLTHALTLAQQGEATWSTLRAYTNLSNLMFETDRLEEASKYRGAGSASPRGGGIGGSGWFFPGPLTAS